MFHHNKNGHTIMLSMIVVILLVSVQFLPLVREDDSLSAEDTLIDESALEDNVISIGGTRETNQESRGSIDSDGDGIPDDEDILDTGNAIFIISIDYVLLDGTADSTSPGDPYFKIWIDLNDDGKVNGSEEWESDVYNDQDEISDEGYFDGGTLWHGLDVPDDIKRIFVRITARDDDLFGEYNTLDISSDKDQFKYRLNHEFTEDGPITVKNSTDGSDDGSGGEKDAKINFTASILAGPTIESVSPSLSKITVNEGESVPFEIRMGYYPDFLSDSTFEFMWLYAFSNDADNWYGLNASNNSYELFAQYGSEGEYLIGCVIYTYYEDYEEHKIDFWHGRIWEVTVVHNNTKPTAEITIDRPNYDQFDSISFSAWKSSDLDGDDDEKNGGSSDVIYKPNVDPANFVEGVDNPYFPLTPGTTMIYEAETEDGTERIEVVVTNDTKVVMGITCMVVRDTVTIGGELFEDTYDWYAQDKDGNVWYMGEDSTEYEDGEEDTAGSWEAGVDGAQPGIIMMAKPLSGFSYRQEYYKGEAEDMGEVLSLNESLTVAYGSFDTLLMIKDWNPLEPDAVEHKYYAEGIGVIAEVEVKGGSERVELVEIINA